MNRRTGTWPLWMCVSRITVSESAPPRLVEYIGRWING